jgi:hypothetical protein
MKRKLLIILLSINLIFLGCSSKSVNTNIPSAVNSNETNTDSVAQRVYGSLVVGIGAVMLTTIAVAILLLVPKVQVQR